MDKEIKFQSESSRKDRTDINWVNEFYEFLQGNCPDCIKLTSHNQPKLTEKKSFAIIWYLQEHMRILPDHIERCDICGELFDTWQEGIHWESKGRHYCGGCDYLVPENYDNICDAK